MAKIKKPMKKAQSGAYVPEKESKVLNVLNNAKGSISVKSEDKNYKAKAKIGKDGSPKLTERRTIKGLLTGAPKAGGKVMQMGGSTKASIDSIMNNERYPKNGTPPNPPSKPKGKVKPPSKGIDIDSMLKKGSKKKDEPKVKLLKKGGKVNKAKSIKKK